MPKSIKHKKTPVKQQILKHQNKVISINYKQFHMKQSAKHKKSVNSNK
jgi:hypothetical protein